MKKQVSVFIVGIVFVTHALVAMDRPSAPPPSPRDGVPAVMTPISAREMKMLLTAAKESGSRQILGLKDVPMLTQEILDTARSAKLAEIETWTVQHFIVLKIANLGQQGNDDAVQERIALLTTLLERVNEKKILLGDQERIGEIIGFYRRVLPIQIRQAHQFLSGCLSEAAAGSAAADDDIDDGYIADDDDV